MSPQTTDHVHFGLGYVSVDAIGQDIFNIYPCGGMTVLFGEPQDVEHKNEVRSVRAVHVSFCSTDDEYNAEEGVRRCDEYQVGWVAADSNCKITSTLAVLLSGNHKVKTWMSQVLRHAAELGDAILLGTSEGQMVMCFDKGTEVYHPKILRDAIAIDKYLVN
ncbi:MAG: hypothetical protein ACYC63_04965 [Armatimonadota bacterium]